MALRTSELHGMKPILTSNRAERAQSGTDTVLIATSTCLAAQGRTIPDRAQSGHSQVENSFMRVRFKSEIGQGMNALTARFTDISETCGKDVEFVDESINGSSRKAQGGDTYVFHSIT